MTLKNRINLIIKKLEDKFKATTSLEYFTPFQMLVSTILSAQCRDEIVNKATKNLFKNYFKASDFNKLNFDELNIEVNSINFHKNKTKNILNSAFIVSSQFNNEVPSNIDDLIKLPGVGRKTANVVLGEVYSLAEGIVVDTHVKRVSKRIGLTKNIDPYKVEIDLKKIVLQESWIKVSHLLIALGKDSCIARNPKCFKCPIIDLCLYKNKPLKV